MLDERNLARLAGRVHEATTRHRAKSVADLIAAMSKLFDRVDDVKVDRTRLDKCLASRLPAAADWLRQGVGRGLREIDDALQRCLQHAEAGPSEIPSMHDVYDELRQIADEFGDVHFDRGERSLVVSTEPIEFDGVRLGPFEIRLRLDRLDEPRCEHALRIVALEPNPAESDSKVTHPHVSNEGLCPGDASAPLSAALRDRRLCDALLIVGSVLKNYNSASPFVALEAWNGTPCWDCACSSDDLAWCCACDHDFCDECVSYCRGCEQTHCLSCLADCAGCDESRCGSCVKGCQQCDKSFCDECLDEGVCADCRETKEHTDENEATPIAPDKPVRTESMEQETAAA